MRALGLDFSIEMQWRGGRLKDINSLILHGCDIAVTGWNWVRVRILKRIPKGMLKILLDCLEYPSHGGNLNARVRLLSGR